MHLRVKYKEINRIARMKLYELFTSNTEVYRIVNSEFAGIALWAVNSMNTRFLWNGGISFSPLVWFVGSLNAGLLHCEVVNGERAILVLFSSKIRLSIK